LKGKLRISTRLREGNLEDMTFDVSGSQLRIEDGHLETPWGGGVRDQWWWGQIDLEKGRMTWKRPLDLDAEIALKLRDSGLLVHLFVKQTQERKWLDELLTITDVSGRSGVRIDDKTLMLEDAKLAGEKLLVLANLRLREKKARGALFASYGILSVGVELRDDERKWKILRPRQWYDDFTQELAAQQP
jgi:hypothetical protein